MISVVLAGVGGQGNVVSAQVIARAALREGYDVKTSEVHGMAQRGGSVVCTVRWGERVHSPLVPSGRADYLLAFELLEGLRYLRYLSRDGVAVVNESRIDPLTVLRGDAAYPEDAMRIIRSCAGRTEMIDARSLAIKAGSLRAIGSCILGALSCLLDFPASAWEEAIGETVPANAVEANLRAFSLGREVGRGAG